VAFRRFLSLNPAVVLAAGVFNGALPLTLAASRGGWSVHWGAVAFSAVVCAVCAAAAFGFLRDSGDGRRHAIRDSGDGRRRAIRLSAGFAVFSLLGAAAAWNALTPSRGSLAAFVSGKAVGAEVRGRFVDTRVGGASVSWLRSPRRVLAEVEEVRLTPRDEWRKVSGSALVSLPPGSPRPLYGSFFQSTGSFSVPGEALVEGGFDYRRYLMSRGIDAVYAASGVRIGGGPPPALWTRLQRAALGFRDWCLAGLSAGMGREERETLAALMFGCRQAVGSATRQEYIRSGVAHVFAISGLHVGMLAAALFAVFRWIPFRFRYWLVPGLLAAYVLTTGSQPSAVRALLMISIWSLNKGALRRASPLNAVFLAAGLMTVFAPLSMLGAGFQYSFAIAAFLVLSWRASGGWLAAFGTRFLFLPRGTVSWRDVARLKAARWFAGGVFTSVTAWLAATGLNLALGNVVVPGAVFANLLIVPIVWTLFAAAAVSAPFLPLGVHVLAPVLNLLVKAVTIVASVGSEACGWTSLPAPSGWTLAVYFAALLGIATARSGRAIVVSSAVLLLCVGGWIWSDVSRPWEVAAFHGGGADTVSLVCVPPGGRGGAVVVDPGPPERAKAINDFLRLRGIDSIDTIYFSRANKASCEAAWAVFAGNRVGTAVFPRRFAGSPYARRAVSAASRSGIRTRFAASAEMSAGLDVLTVVRSGGWRLRVERADWRCFAKTAETAPGERRLEIRVPPDFEVSETFLNSRDAGMAVWWDEDL